MRRAHWTALKAALEPLGYEVYFTDATTKNLPDGTREVPAPPYLVVWSDSGRIDSPDLADAHVGTDARFGLTWVATSPEAALVVGERARNHLTPAGRGDLPGVPGERVWLLHEDTRGVQVDRDVVARDSNRHPAYGVDMFRLISTPA